MEVEDWRKGVEKKLMIAQCMDRERVLFAAHQLFGTTSNWWETYCSTHVDVDSITWNEFKAHFRNHYVPRGTMKLKKKEFTNLRQSSMTVNEYLNSFIQLSRYTTEDIDTDEKKQDTFLEGLNDDIQFQLLNADYADFQHMIDKAIIIESKLKEMEKDGKRKMSFPEQSSGSNVRPRFSQPNQFFQAIANEPNADTDANAAPPISDATTIVPDVDTKCSYVANITADEPTRCAAVATIEPATSISPHSATYTECTKPRRSRFGPLFQV
jgi:hypothetical protein